MEANGREEGGRKDEKEENEESNSLMFLFLPGVVVENEGLGMAGEGLVAELRTDENEESRILSAFLFGVIAEDNVPGRRIPDVVGLLPAGVGFLLVI